MSPDRSRAALWRAQLPFAEVQISALISGEVTHGDLPQQPFNVVILDVSGRSDGAELVRTIRAGLPSSRVLALSDPDEKNLTIELVRAGARGHDDVSISPLQLSRAVELVAAGGVWFRRAVLPELLREFREPVEPNWQGSRSAQFSTAA